MAIRCPEENNGQVTLCKNVWPKDAKKIWKVGGEKGCCLHGWWRGKELKEEESSWGRSERKLLHYKHEGNELEGNTLKRRAEEVSAYMIGWKEREREGE